LNPPERDPPRKPLKAAPRPPPPREAPSTVLAIIAALIGLVGALMLSLWLREDAPKPHYAYPMMQQQRAPASHCAAPAPTCRQQPSCRPPPPPPPPECVPEPEPEPEVVDECEEEIVEEEDDECAGFEEE
jgi:hypothetical protein